MSTLTVKVSVHRKLGVFWAIARAGLRSRVELSRVSGIDAVTKVAAAYLGCDRSEVILAKQSPGNFSASCSALPSWSE